MTDVLALGPHPDDVELSAGATLALLSSTGRTVGIIDLTRGELATRGTPEQRTEEASQAARILGAGFRENLELPDGGVSARDPGHLAAVVGALRRHRPRLVITLHGKDDHPDHTEGAELVRRAAYVAGLRNYPGSDAEPHRPGAVIYAMGRGSFEPSLVIPVDATYARKREALACYGSQFRREPCDPLVTPISEPGFLDFIEARDRVHGAAVGSTFGEPFAQDGPVRTVDPMSLIQEPS